MTKIFLDPGHGGHDNGASANGLREKELVLDIGLKARTILRNEYEGVQVRMSRETDVFIPLNDRGKMARDWGADAFVSIHLNAFNGTANGTETFKHENSTASTPLQKALHDAILTELRKHGTVTDRGLKNANFAVLRGTYQSMLSVLTESLFLDNKRDAELLKKDGVIDAIARAHVNGVAKELGLKRKAEKPAEPTPKPKAPPNTARLLRLQTPFMSGEDVKDVQSRLNALGFNAGTADGIFGPNTDNAVKSFQKARNITVDGIVGPQTLTELAKDNPKPKAEPKPSLPNVVYRATRPYPNGSGVRAVQEAVASLRFFPDRNAPNNGVDGIYGPKSSDAVRRFQSMYGLKQDGIYGPQTRAKLLEVM